jgi:Acyl-CoA carboxylase epsilon subunit
MTLHDPDNDAISLRIVRGAPDGDEIAAATVALLAVLRLRATQDASPSGPRTPGWNQPYNYGPPGAWATA